MSSADLTSLPLVSAPNPTTFLLGCDTSRPEGQRNVAFQAPIIANLAADFQVASQAALQNAPGMAVALAANGLYLIDVVGYFYTQGATNGGWRFGLNYSGTFNAPAINQLGGMLTTAGTYNGSFINALNGTLTSLSNANPDFCQYRGLIQPATGGTLQFQFAQNTSNATASILKVGSSIVATRVG